MKGGIPLKPIDKKKRKKHKSVEGTEKPAEEAGAKGGPQKAPVDAAAISVQSGKTYEQEFDFEQKRLKEGKTRTTPWGSTFRAPPEILHGYTTKVTGKNPQERLDLRCASKSDKFCK